MWRSSAGSAGARAETCTTTAAAGAGRCGGLAITAGRPRALRGLRASAAAPPPHFRTTSSCSARPSAPSSVVAAASSDCSPTTAAAQPARRAGAARPVPPLASVRVPHCGYHYDGLPRRFFEGWYWKVQLPDTNDSFALIYSIEDPDGTNENSGVGMQVMGPKDGYICQFSGDVECFWASRNELELGAGIAGLSSGAPRTGGISTPRGGLRLGKMVPEDDFFRQVECGFQASYTRHTGRMIASEAGTAGEPYSTVSSCSWDLSIKPMQGWGNNSGQKATAGWLSVLSVFEPHWQILMADGVASGWLDWGGKRYEFDAAPAYAEKNWGGGFPSKWAWAQCNSFDGCPGLSVTAVGARRALALGLPGIEEDVGLIGIHLPNGGPFLELVPWTGDVEWSIDPWGRWMIRARDDDYEALLEATCDQSDGTTLRAPTFSNGLAPFCRDTFYGKLRLRVWRRRAGGPSAWGPHATHPPMLDATSSSAALEVGGGPWWAAWVASAAMKEPFRSLVQLPIDVGALSGAVPGPFKPPGL